MNKNQLDQTFSDLNHSVYRNVEDKEKTLSKIRLTIDKEISRKRLSITPFFALGISVVFLVIIFMSLNNNDVFFQTANEETITDTYTEKNLEKTDVEDGMFVIRYGSDNMEWGDNPHNYIARELVIDPNYYENQEIQRGEVVFYNQPDAFYDIWKEKGIDGEPSETTIARIIALPGEKINITKGQIYINGLKLDTFYGNGTNNIRSNDYEKEYKMETITVPNGHVFVSSDLWWRGMDSKEYGPIPLEDIIGKVIGYYK
jgi:signal peptidase I